MASAAPAKPDAAKPAAAATKTPVAPTKPATFADVWQVPVMLIAAAMLIAAISTVVARRPKPDFDRMLEEVQATVDEQQYEAALATLNTKILPFLDKPVISTDNRRLFHTLVARTIYLWQQGAEVKHKENYASVVDEYTLAERENAPLSAADSACLVDSYIALDELNAAMERVGKLRDVQPKLRFMLERKLIEKAMEGGKATQVMTAELLAGLLAEPELPREVRIWATARQTTAMLGAGFADDAIARLLKTLPRLAASETNDLGELYLALGEAYLKVNAVGEATKQFERAAVLLDAGSQEMGRAQLMLGRVAELTKNLDDAKERYEWIIASLTETPVARAAILGLAQVDAARGEIEQAIMLFSEIVNQVKAGKSDPETSTEVISASLTGLSNEAFNAGDSATALRYASLAEILFGPDTTPTGLMKLLGTINLKLAQDAALAARSAEPVPGGDAIVKRNFLDAARYFSTHASRLVLDAGHEHADSLWAAADCFDRGGDRESAMTAFQEFRTGFPADPRQSEAVFRLARSHQARGEFPDAAALYSSLIESPASGRFADDSYVPLAQTYLLDNNPDNDDRAMDLLNTIVGGSLGGPNTDNFRDGLVALGELLYERGRNAVAKSPTGEIGGGIDAGELFAQAISRLGEVELRFSAHPKIEGVRFKLADACRLSARVIDAKLNEAMPDAQKRELEKTRSDRLTRAQSVFEVVRRALDGKDAKGRSALDELHLRNAYFYLADCAFDLGDYEGAIRKYDAAREKYATEPASLVAMVQIVNAYLKLGDVKRAAAANEYARRFYASLPESVWNDPNLPMTRRDWQRWLDATDELTKLRQAAAGSQ